MRVLLINSPTLNNPIAHKSTYYPMGLLSIATLLKREGIETSIIDSANVFARNNFGINDIGNYINDLAKYIREFKPDIIGIGAVFSGAFGTLIEFAKGIKDYFPNIPISIGGIHATIFAQQILEKYDCINFVIKGEGDYSFLELINCLKYNKSISNIDGLCFRSYGSVICNPKKSFVSNLDNLPFPEFDILDSSNYQIDTSGWYSPRGLEVGQPFPLISSRSCPHRCSFCSMWLVHGPKFRARSAKNVVDEIESLYNKGVKYFEFMDDNLTFDKTRTLDICNYIINRNIKIQFATPNGIAINSLDQEVVNALVGAGLVRVALAVEHGSDYIRKKVMRKPLNTEKVYEIADACAKHKSLYIIGYFVIGMPQETKETLDDTYKIIRNLPLDHFQINWATPYPGTELFNYCIQNNLLSGKIEDYMNTEHLHYNTEKPHFKPHDLTIEELVDFRDKCFDYLKERREKLGVANNIPLR